MMPATNASLRMLTFFFAGFIILILVLIAVDLGVIHRREHVIGIREALGWMCVWVSFALAFNVLVYFLYGRNWLGFTDAYATELTGGDAAKRFLAGYLVELSLSMDNLFVFATILTYFRVPLIHQHRVLVWGILGAIILRGVMIGIGAALIHAFDWIVYVFGAMLIGLAVRMLLPGSETIHPEKNIFIWAARKLYPVSADLHGSRFFVRVNGVLTMTPLFLALILVDVADVMFAVDSIPAIFAITDDTFIVFTSNIFAILGLRSMYFALAGLMHRFRYLKPAIVLLLGYVGMKMILSHHYPISIEISLAVIGGTLALGIAASILADTRASRRVSP